MSNPIEYRTNHRASFQEIDLYGHLNTIHYISYFLNHRFAALRERFELDLKAISELKVAFYTKNLSVDFLRPVFGDQPFVIRSLLAERDEGSCQVTCEMLDERERPLARCTMHLVCVDKETKRPGTWPQGFMEKFYE